MYGEGERELPRVIIKLYISYVSIWSALLTLFLYMVIDTMHVSSSYIEVTAGNSHQAHNSPLATTLFLLYIFVIKKNLSWLWLRPHRQA